MQHAEGNVNFPELVSTLKTIGYDYSNSAYRPLPTAYSSRDAFVKAIPKMIIEHNLHGIDIDARAVQIAALALWLRAQKAWKNIGIKVADRPRVVRSNIVTAEPMPGEADMKEEFTASLKPRVLGQLVDAVFDKMKLAGEAGSLLKIEEEIKDSVAKAKEEYRKELRLRKEEAGYLSGMAPERAPTIFDFADMSDEDFLDQSEDAILAALKEYAERAENGHTVRRRLFADDAARGFSFIDLCRKRYDVVLMNPPFGEASRPSKTYIEIRYAYGSGDVFQAFVQAMISLVQSGGRVGTLSARTGFFLGNSESWRRDVVFQNRLACFVDLGLGVLDSALVEVAAYVIERGKPDSRQLFVNRQLSTRDKEPGLHDSVQTLEAELNDDTFLVDQSIISKVPGCVFAYWAPARLLRRYATQTLFGEAVASVRQGIATADDFRFVRLGWEVRSNSIGRKKSWIRFSKGGEYSPFFDDIHLLVHWANDGEQLKAFPRCYVRNEGLYFSPGATYTVRTASAFAAKALSADCIFSHNAQSWFVDSNERSLLSIAFLSCRVPQAFLELAVGAGDIASAGSAARRYTTAVVESVPSEPIEHINNARNRELTYLLLLNRMREFARLETSCLFGRFAITVESDGLKRSALHATSEILDEILCALEWSKELDDAVTVAFSLVNEEIAFIENEVGPHPCSYTKEPKRSEVSRLLNCSVEELMRVAVENQSSKRWFTKKSYFVDRRIEIASHILEASPKVIVEAAKEDGITLDLMGHAQSVISECIGVIVGRWDVRIVLDPSLAPKLLDPFDPLPSCPPGMLVGQDALPAEPNRIVSEEWLRARPDANTLPPEGAISKPTIPDTEYPLRIAWNGILVDDPGFNGTQPHRDDIVRRVREVLDLLWKEKAHEIEQEACDILGVSDLRDYFRKPAKFFQDHLKRYSKSRRKAPIYWPLSTASGSYTIWMYYHRLNDQTLYAAVNKYVEPKISEVERSLDWIEDELKVASGGEATRLRDRLNETQTLLSELRDLREELLWITALPYKPDLNDGVIINAAPLNGLFNLRSWANDTKKVWDRLKKGEYDWAHLAYTIWPDRVRDVCKKDRSISIAHGLEALCEVEISAADKKRRKKNE